ncbi:hypothetical protein [Nostoc sp.]
MAIGLDILSCQGVLCLLTPTSSGRLPSGRIWRSLNPFPQYAR